MATAETLSPNSDGRCLLQPSNSTSLSSNAPDSITFQKPENTVGFKSAPETEIDPNEHQIPNAGRPWKSRRRKRRNSMSEHASTGIIGNQNGKRRRGNGNHKKQPNASGRIILPNKFLLGGNISDPLNLNSMMDENINRALNAVTPSSSPLPPRNSIIDIVQPSDVTDPLGLNSNTFDKPTVTPENSKNKSKRKRRRKSQAMRQEQQQNSDTTSNSDDQKLNTKDTSKNQDEPGGLSAKNQANASDNIKGSLMQQKKKKQSPPKTVSRLTVSATQPVIRDPIVSPVVPQDTRRFRTSGSKFRRRKHATGRPSTIDAGIQTESQEFYTDEQQRCRSEKTTKRQDVSPVKRRRTMSENLMPASYWEEEDLKEVRIRSFFKEPVTVPGINVHNEVSSLLSQPLCGNTIRSPRDDINKNGKSPSQNFMNKELKIEKDKHTDEGSSTPVVVPKPSAGYYGYETTERQKSDKVSIHKGNSSNASSSKKPQKAHFQYGNYSKYYGYRNPEKFKDVRMECLKKEWFKDKDVLDIGCNAGHLTLLVARNYEPRKIVGVDIDDGLVRTARNNIRHYASVGKTSTKFPASMAISFGPLACPPVETGKDDTTAAFPNNINFFQGNYVPQKDEFLRYQEPEYDVIMCMSVTKWIHLNWGDEGLIRMFRRVFKQLRAGGMFILEPQQWDSYKSKRRLSEKLTEMFRTIKLFPQSFPSFLIREIGFERVEHLAFQKKDKTGFQRPIQVYYKPE